MEGEEGGEGEDGPPMRRVRLCAGREREMSLRPGLPSWNL